MPSAGNIHDDLEGHDRIFLDKLRIAVEVLLEAAQEPGTMSDALESEVFAYQDRLLRALLLRG